VAPLIGWFVAAAAAGEVRMGARDALRGLHVSDVMVWDPVTLPAGARLRDAVDRVIAHTGYTAYPVTDDGDAVGLLASAGVTSLPGEALDELRVRDRMIPAARALTVTPEDDLPDAAAALAQTDLGRALVVRDRRLVGLLSITDVRRALALRERAMAHR
jgi:CBS domain-containing protein